MIIILQFAHPLFIWTKANSYQLKQQFVWSEIFFSMIEWLQDRPHQDLLWHLANSYSQQWLRLCSLEVLWIIITTTSHFPHHYPHFSRQYRNIPKHNTPPLFVYVVYFCITVFKVWLSFIVFVQMYVLSMYCKYTESYTKLLNP